MSIRERLLDSSSIKKNLVSITLKEKNEETGEVKIVEDFGKVLFIEPSIADLKNLKDRTLKIKSQNMTVDKKNADDSKVNVEFDIENTNMEAYNKGLVMLTSWEEDKTFDAVFSKEGDNIPRHGQALLNLFIAGASSVIKQADIEEEKKSS
jgi:hypothetical protein